MRASGIGSNAVRERRVEVVRALRGERMHRLGRWIVGLAALLVAAGTAAQAAEPYGVRGTLVGVDGKVVTLMNDDEETFEVALTDDTGYFAVTPAEWEDIGAGQFVGITSIEAGGERVALEVHIFAEDLRGVGEGHYPWDLVKDPNMMTNATVAEIKEVDPTRRQLHLTYKEGEGEKATEGEQVIMVPDFVEVVRLAKGEPSDLLAPDRRAFLLVVDAEQGPPAAVAVAVGLEGAIPPM
jgi:hypothetical protein